MHPVTRPLQILGTGIALPTRKVTADALDRELGRKPGFSVKISGPFQRYFVDSETTSELAAKASLAALAQASLSFKDIDLILCASGLIEQPIPSSAVLMSHHLGISDLGIPAYDINATCLSFLTAFDTISDAIAAGRYKNVLIVSSELPSRGLNWSHPEISVLFGDGAAAAVLGYQPQGSPKGIVASHFETYADGARFCEVRAGGTRLRLAQDGMEAFADGEKYEMDGVAAYKLTAQRFPAFLETLLKRAKMTLDDIDLVIPHQASRLALDHLTSRLGIPSEKVIDIFDMFGNQVAASLPTALHHAREIGRVKEGMNVLLAGTAAGLTFGGIIVRV